MGRPLCERCKNFIKFDENFNAYCKVFPNGIPDDFYSHLNPWKPPKNCDNGIGFEPIDADDE